MPFIVIVQTMTMVGPPPHVIEFDPVFLTSIEIFQLFVPFLRVKVYDPGGTDDPIPVI